MKNYIAILYSLDQEIRFLKKSFIFLKKEKLGKRNVFLFEFKGKNILLFKIGVGAKNIEQNLNSLTQRYNISKFMLIGFAGAVNNKLKVGDIIKPQQNHILYTVDKIYNKKDKELLRKKDNSISAIDMESSHFSTWAKQNKKNFSIIKAISDPFNFKMPQDTFIFKYFNKIKFNQTFFKDLIKNPLDIIRVIKLKIYCLAASFYLAKSVKTEISSSIFPQRGKIINSPEC